jgi:RNA polymerase sigma factor (sigma-70 family)
MSSIGSVSIWLGQLQGGDESALTKLHQRYWPTIVARARRQLKGAPLRAVDEEDIANSAFLSLHEAIRSGRTPRLQNRHHLLALLTTIVACKATNEIKHAMRQKRGGGQSQETSDMAVLMDDEFSPLQQALLSDCYEHYLKGLPQELRAVAELYLADYTHREIAERQGCVERTVERKLQRVLVRWQEMAAADLTQDMRALLCQSSSASAETPLS